MLRLLRQKDFSYPIAIWLVVLIWYIAVGARIFPSLPAILDQVISSQSFWLFNNPPKESDNIVIVAIDQASRQRLGLKWPWKRSVTAQLIRNITASSPRVIGLDIVFSGDSEESEDQALTAALKTHPRVVLGYLLNKNDKEGPKQAFVDAAASIGFVNKARERGVVDSVTPCYLDTEGAIQPSIETAILAQYLGIQPSDIRIHDERVCLGDTLCIPFRNEKTPLNYLIFHSRFTTVPAYLVLERRVNPATFKDKIVLIGATDQIIHDEYPTPLGIFPGVTILGNSLVMAMSQRFLQPVSFLNGLLCALFLGALMIVVNKWLSYFCAALSSFFLLFLTHVAFVYMRSQDLVFPYVTIFLSGIVAYLAYNLHKYGNLMYVSNHLKNQAIVDPLTGLFTPRFFLLQLQEEAKLRKPFTVIGLKIANYDKLIMNLSFEQIRALLKNLGEFLSSKVHAEFKKASISCLSTQMLGIFVPGAQKDDSTRFLKQLLMTSHGKKWELGDITLSAPLQACLIVKPGAVSIDSPDVLSQLRGLFQRGSINKVVIEEIRGSMAEKGGREKKIDHRDTMDFLAYDWEERNKDLEKSLEELLKANKHLEQLNWGTLKALARAIDAKSAWTAGHSERVTELALKIGKALKLPPEELTHLQRGGLLHDIGKIATPMRILDKPGPLTQEERQLICQHPAQGARILEPLQDFAPAYPVVLQHHECFDGSGYPDGLAGEAINFNARILAVADVFDAVTSDRPYREGMPLERALDIIKKGRGTQFDPIVVDAFFTVMAEQKNKGKADPALQSIPENTLKALAAIPPQSSESPSIPV